MKLVCTRSQLDSVLAHVARIVTPRSTLPVLSNLLLETDGQLLRISATDLDLAITSSVEATIAQEGSFTVPAKLFQEFIHQCPDSEITFTLQGQALLCEGDVSTATIPGIDAEEYPALPEVKPKAEFTVSAEAVVQALKRVVVACAQDQGRPILTGVLWRIAEGSLTLAATDSFRLGEVVITDMPANLPEIDLIIPHRTIQELIRVATQNASENVTVLVADNQVVFRIDGIDLYSRLLTGNFPKYHAIIPSVFQADVEVGSSEVQQALRLAATFGQAGVANVSLTITEDSLEVMNHGGTRGSARQKIPVKVLGEKLPLTVAFSARFLIDALNASESDKVTLRFSGVTSPLVVVGTDAAHTQLVMPIRL